ncbi:MAG TPA: hypothetical protein VLN56_05770 [Gammaproteobacteria bacterium]|nr:hypothetical protein [Gammaproteobacteria bacterium]
MEIPAMGMLFGDTESPMLETCLALTETFSPYQLNPLEKMELPTTAEEIRERTSELGFSTAFMREMRAIAYSKKIIENDWSKFDVSETG